MTLGMGRCVRAWCNAFCRPSASVTPGSTVSTNSASALPSGARCSVGTAAASSPSAASFFSSAAVGWPLASSPTATGISFCRCAWSAARAATCVMCTARRRGVANGVTAALEPLRPCACSASNNCWAKAWPSFFSALGGSSSTNSSTSSGAVAAKGTGLAEAAMVVSSITKMKWCESPAAARWPAWWRPAWRRPCSRGAVPRPDAARRHRAGHGRAARPTGRLR